MHISVDNKALSNLFIRTSSNFNNRNSGQKWARFLRLIYENNEWLQQ